MIRSLSSRRGFSSPKDLTSLNESELDTHSFQQQTAVQDRRPQTTSLLLQSKDRARKKPMIGKPILASIKDRIKEEQEKDGEKPTPEEQIGSLASTTLDLKNKIQRSNSKSSAAPVLGVPFNRSMSQNQNSDFPKLNLGTEKEILNLKGPAQAKLTRAQTERKSLPVRTILSTYRESGANVQEDEETPKQRVIMEKPSYRIASLLGQASPQRRSHTAATSRSKQFRSMKSMVGTGRNSVEPFESHKDNAETVEEPPKEGSLLKYFRNSYAKSKSMQVFKVNKELSIKYRVPAPPVEVNFRAMSSAPGQKRPSHEGDTSIIKGKTSRRNNMSPVRPMSMASTMGGSIMDAEESVYIKSFVGRVEGYLTKKKEPRRSMDSPESPDNVNEKEPFSPLMSQRHESKGEASPFKLNLLDLSKMSRRNNSIDQGKHSLSPPNEKQSFMGHSFSRIAFEPDRQKSFDKCFTGRSSEAKTKRHSLNVYNDWLNYEEGQIQSHEKEEEEEEDQKERKTTQMSLRQQEEERQAKLNNLYSVDTVKGLVNYARSMSKEIENYIIASAKKVVRNTDRYEKALGISHFIEIKGGIQKQNVKLNPEKCKNFLEERKSIGSIYKEIEKLKTSRIEEQENLEKFYTNRDRVFENAMRIRPAFLTQKELGFAKEYFTKREVENNMIIEKLDDILQRLRFFNLLNKEARIELYKKATYASKTAGTYIYEEGDHGDLMYIILRGSVNVKSKRVLDDGEVHVITVASLGDGSHFGDVATVVRRDEAEAEQIRQKEKTTAKVKNLAFVREQNKQTEENEAESKEEAVGAAGKGKSPSKKEEKKKVEVKEIKPVVSLPKRTVSIQCAEPCEVLVLERDHYERVLSEILNKDVNTKLNLLSLIPFFKGLSSANLVPVTTNLRKVSFKLGQRIIQEGQPVMSFYILLKGKCSVVKEVIDDRRAGRDHYEPKLRNFKYKDFSKKNGQQGGKEENRESQQLLSKSTSRLDEIVERVTEGVEEEKAPLKEKLKPFKFSSLNEILQNLKKTAPTPNVHDRTFDNEPVEVKDESKQLHPTNQKKRPGHMAKKHIAFRELITGDIFGFRPLCRREPDAQYRDLEESKARLSVIATSGEVQLYMLTRDSLVFLPENVKNLLLDNIEKMQDFDDYDIEEGLAKFREMRKFKLELAKEVFTKPDPGLEKIIELYTYKAY